VPRDPCALALPRACSLSSRRNGGCGCAGADGAEAQGGVGRGQGAADRPGCSAARTRIGPRARPREQGGVGWHGNAPLPPLRFTAQAQHGLREHARARRPGVPAHEVLLNVYGRGFAHACCRLTLSLAGMGKRGTRSSGEEAVMGSTIIGSPSKRTRSLRCCVLQAYHAMLVRSLQLQLLPRPPPPPPAPAPMPCWRAHAVLLLLCRVKTGSHRSG